MSGCPSLDELEQLVRAELTPGAAACVRAHLEGCAPCHTQYAECAANQNLAAELRRVWRGPVAATEATIAPCPAPAPALPAIAGYRVIREIHRGGQGVVYEAFQTATRRRVALKVMLGGPFAGAASKRRFEREVELAARLRHPNIVAIHDSGVASGSYYFAMDYVDGVRLDEYGEGRRDKGTRGPREGVAAVGPVGRGGTGSAQRTERLSLRDVLLLFTKICDAVNYAHQRGVMHRDLKPSNILVDTEGEPRVLDFGLAKQLEESETSTQTVRTAISMAGQVFGTLAYMSP